MKRGRPKKSDKEIKNKYFRFRCDELFRVKLELQVLQNNTTISKYVRGLIETDIEQGGK